MTWPRGGAVLAVLCVALLAWPAATAKAPSDEASFRTVAHVAPGAPFAVHGGTLLWFEPSADRADLVMETLGDAQLKVLTTVGPARGLSLRSLSFDGRYAAWSDNRFGNMEVFAFDTQGGALQRVTQAGPDDVDPVVDEGRVAWSRMGQLWVRDLGNGTSWQVPGADYAHEPALAGPTIAWIHVNGFDRSVHWSSLSGADPGSVTAPGSLDYNLRAERGLVAWEAWQQRDPAAPVKGFKSSVLQVMVDGQPPANVTTVPAQSQQGTSLGTAVGGGRVAWVDPSVPRLGAWKDGQVTAIAATGDQVAVSDRYLVVEKVDPSGDAVLAARPWDWTPPSHGLPTAGAGLAALSILAVAAPAARRRR